jgi:hypothetical protein
MNQLTPPAYSTSAPLSLYIMQPVAELKNLISNIKSLILEQIFNHKNTYFAIVNLTRSIESN